MQDRIPVNPGRVLITPEDGSAAFYATMARADNPTQNGTLLNKANLLKDATAAMYGLGGDAVPDDVLERIPDLIAGRAQVATGSYTGTGTFGISNPNSLTFDFVPLFIILIGRMYYNPDVLILARGVTEIGVLGGRSSSYTNYVTWDDKTVQWYVSADDAEASYQMNELKTVYDYVAIG